MSDWIWIIRLVQIVIDAWFKLQKDEQEEVKKTVAKIVNERKQQNEQRNNGNRTA